MNTLLFSNIKIGDRIEITAKDRVYISQVENILDEAHLLIHVPISYGQLIKLPIDFTYKFLFFTDNGMIRFESNILEYTKQDGFYLMRVKLILPGEKMQRRNFFRFACLLPFKFSVIGHTGDAAPDNAMFDGIIKDIGGGGIRFVCNDPIEENTKIKCLIMLNEDYFIIIGKVLHKQYFPKSVYKYQCRAIFTGILPSEQERIVQFIFAEQRKSLHLIENREY